jgi:hypothetical protein
MYVDTPSADDERVADGPEEDALQAAVDAAEWVLANRFGSPIKLSEPEDLAGSGPAIVVRARVVSSPFSLPKTLVIKHYRKARGFATESASYQLFTALTSEERMCPEPLGHDKDRRVLVLSDLGRAPTLEDKLRLTDARAAERSLLSWARALGRMHATTARREADFNTLLRRLGGTARGEDAERSTAVERLPGILHDVLGVETSSAVFEQVIAAAARVQAGRFRAFSPVDLSPENNLVTGNGVRFLDFEHGCVRNALIDVAHLRVPFAFWQGALGLPAGMSEAMIAGWRAEVLPTWPQLADDEEFAAALLDSQLLCVWTQTHQELPGLATTREGGPTSRTAALESWWRELARQAKRSGAGDLAAHAEAVAAALDVRFGPGLELAMYPAFR